MLAFGVGGRLADALGARNADLPMVVLALPQLLLEGDQAEMRKPLHGVFEVVGSESTALHHLAELLWGIVDARHV